MRSQGFKLAGLILALAGYWSPWLTHRAAALRLNAFELSEWVTFLPPGLVTGWPAPSRLLFLAPLACLAVLCGLLAARRDAPAPLPLLSPGGSAANQTPPAPRQGLPGLAPGWGWLLLGAGIGCALMVVPPWPYVLTAFADPEFRLQMFVALAAVLGAVGAAAAPAALRVVLQTLFAGAAAFICGAALLAVRPAASEVLNAAWPLGLGWFAALAGFGALAVSGLAHLLGPRE